jgi:hypothetical protein
LILVTIMQKIFENKIFSFRLLTSLDEFFTLLLMSYYQRDIL